MSLRLNSAPLSLSLSLSLSIPSLNNVFDFKRRTQFFHQLVTQFTPLWILFPIRGHLRASVPGCRPVCVSFPTFTWPRLSGLSQTHSSPSGGSWDPCGRPCTEDCFWFSVLKCMQPKQEHPDAVGSAVMAECRPLGSCGLSTVSQGPRTSVSATKSIWLYLGTKYRKVVIVRD